MTRTKALIRPRHIFDAIDAVNTQDPAFQTALEGGVTTVVTGPAVGIQ